jgi:hypothetical protein
LYILTKLSAKGAQKKGEVRREKRKEWGAMRRKQGKGG